MTVCEWPWITNKWLPVDTHEIQNTGLPPSEKLSKLADLKWLSIVAIYLSIILRDIFHNGSLSLETHPSL